MGSTLQPVPRLWEHRVVTAVRDVLSHVVAAVVLLVTAAVFLGGAYAGLQMIDRLGSIGLGMYAVAMIAWGLLFVPLVTYAIGLRQRGSRRHREALRQRQELEQLRYGLRSPDEPA